MLWQIDVKNQLQLDFHIWLNLSVTDFWNNSTVERSNVFPWALPQIYYRSGYYCIIYTISIRWIKLYSRYSTYLISHNWTPEGIALTDHNKLKCHQRGHALTTKLKVTSKAMRNNYFELVWPFRYSALMTFICLHLTMTPEGFSVEAKCKERFKVS